jgi:hypothetical protein
LNNYFISPFGDILLLVVLSVLLGVLIAPYVRYITRIYDTVRMQLPRKLRLWHYQDKVFSYLSKKLDYPYYVLWLSVDYDDDDTKISIEETGNLTIWTADVKIRVRAKDIKAFKSRLNKAIRESKS